MFVVVVAVVVAVVGDEFAFCTVVVAVAPLHYDRLVFVVAVMWFA